MELLTCLRRGVAAGAVGGALAGGFGVTLAESVMDRAVELESAREQAEAAAGQASASLQHAEVFTRPTQHAGLLVASLVTGLALGVLFSLVYYVVHSSRHRGDRMGDTDGWRRALTLGAAAWFAVSVVPFLRYPSNPPGVGDPGTLDLRTRGYLAAVAIGLAGVTAALRLSAELRRRGALASSRQLAVAGVLLLTLALPFLLPADSDALDVPAGLLWEFRVLAFVTSGLLWAGLAVTFGLLTERSERSSAATVLLGG